MATKESSTDLSPSLDIHHLLFAGSQMSQWEVELICTAAVGDRSEFAPTFILALDREPTHPQLKWGQCICHE